MILRYVLQCQFLEFVVNNQATVTLKVMSQLITQLTETLLRGWNVNNITVKKPWLQWLCTLFLLICSLVKENGFFRFYGKLDSCRVTFNTCRFIIGSKWRLEWLWPGESVARLVEGASWSVHEPAPTPLQKMAARIAWGSTRRLKIAILSLVMVSKDIIYKCLIITFPEFWG